MVRFFLDAMNGAIKSFSPSLRIAAAKELIGCAFPLLTRVKRPRTAAPKPAQPTQTDEAAAEPSVQSLNGHPERCSCRTCVRSAMSRFRLTHCEQGEEIHQYIVRRAMAATRDDRQRIAEVNLIWNEYMTYIRRLCPESTIDQVPAWFYRLLEHDPHYPDGYNPKLVQKHYDFWMYDLDKDDEDLLECDCEDCGDHERDDYGYCHCEICFFDSEDDP